MCLVCLKDMIMNEAWLLIVSIRWIVTLKGTNDLTRFSSS